MTIYDITNRLLLLQELLESEELDPEVLADTMEAVEGEYEIKLEGYCKVIKNLEGSVLALKSEADRLTTRRKSIEKNIEALKLRMFESMKATGNTKVKGDLFTVSIQKNGGKAPVVVDVDTADLPDNLVRITEAPDIDAIRRYLDTVGESEYAHIGERGESLRIK